MSKHTILSVDAWDFDFFLFVGRDFKKHSQYFAKMSEKSGHGTLDEKETKAVEERFIFPGANGLCLWMKAKDGTHVWALWFRDNPEISDIAHECTHLAYHVLHDKGQRHTDRNHECLAYLIGHLTGKVCGTVAKMGK